MSPRRKIVFIFFALTPVLIFLTCYLGFKTGRRINILLLGTPGGDYPGHNLSDSIILFSVDPNRQDLVVTSIPRDIWVESSQTKINALYILGGLDLVKAEVVRILGLEEIDFAAVVNFEALKKSINLVGGLEVEVEHPFDDFRYPLPGKENDDCNGDPEYRCRYQTLHFEQGLTHMDGDLALKFVRSRFATDSAEGTDFARSKRQQKIISAFRQKLFAEKFFFKPIALWGLWEIFRQHVTTDLNFQNGFSLLNILFRGNWSNPRIFVLDWGEKNQGGPLVNPPPEEYGSWVLVPRDGNWQETQSKFKNFLNSDSQTD